MGSFVSSNLIRNSSGEDTLTGWTITGNGENHWICEEWPEGSDGVPPNELLGVYANISQLRCFATGSTFCAKSYTVDFDEDLSLKVPFIINCAQMYTARHDSGGNFKWRLKLLDSSKNILREMNTGYDLPPQPIDHPWKVAQYSFHFTEEDIPLVRKIRYLEFEHGSGPSMLWGGNHGMKLARSTVVLEKLDMNGVFTVTCDTPNPSMGFTLSDQNTQEETVAPPLPAVEPSIPQPLPNSEDTRDWSTCPTCLEIPRNKKVFQCREGHIVCESCFPNVKKCPLCRGPLSNNGAPIRNRALENAIQALKL